MTLKRCSGASPPSLAVAFLLGTLVTIPHAWGQQVSAAITGKVTDPSDAPLAGAKVTATDVARGTVRTTETNIEGFYNLPRVPVGSYEIRVEMAGFQTAVRPPFELVLNQSARVDFQLKLGQINQAVEVVGEPPLLSKDSSQLGVVIDSNTHESLPLATRNYVQLTLLVPGSVHPDPSAFRTE